MNTFETVCRYEDMSPDGKLELIKQFDGDIIKTFQGIADAFASQWGFLC